VLDKRWLYPGVADGDSYTQYVLHCEMYEVQQPKYSFQRITEQWRTQKISEGGAKFRLIRETSQINFRGSAGGTPPGKFCKITPANTHFCAFWKQDLV